MSGTSLELRPTETGSSVGGLWESPSDSLPPLFGNLFSFVSGIYVPKGYVNLVQSEENPRQGLVQTRLGYTLVHQEGSY